MNLVEEYADKEITINEENYDAYKKLSCITCSKDDGILCDLDFYDKFGEIIFIFEAGILIISIFVCGIASAFIVNNLINNFLISTLFEISVSAGMFYLSFKLPHEHLKKRNLRLFKRDYPSINQDVDINDLKKELTKYEELSKIPKDIEHKKEEHITTIQSEFNKKTTTEKINMLKEEYEYEQERPKQKVYDL